jgi:hypothetical protein
MLWEKRENKAQRVNTPPNVIIVNIFEHNNVNNKLITQTIRAAGRRDAVT